MSKNKNISVEVNKLEDFLIKENVNPSKIINYKLFIEQILCGYLTLNGNFKFDFKTLIKHKKHLIIISSKGLNKNLLQSDVVINNLMKNIGAKALWKYKNHNNIIIIDVKTTTSSNLLEMYKKYLRTEKKKIAIVVIFWFLGIVTELVSPIINATLIQYIIDTEFNRIVVFSCIFSFTCILCHIFTVRLNKELNNIFNIFLDKVQPDLAKNILNCKTECFDNNGSGFFIQILSNETKSMMNSFQQLYANLSSINSLIGIIIAYLILSPYIFFIEIIAVVGFLWIENYRTNRLNHADKKYRIVNDKFISFSNEIIKGVNDIKLLYRKKWVVNKFRELSESNNKLFVQMHNSSLNLKLLRRELAELWNFIFTIGIAFAILLWGFLPSTAIFILTYNTRIIYSASIIGNLMEIYKSINLSLDRIFSVLTNDSFVKDKFGDKVLNKIKGNLKLQDIKFSYKSQNPLYKSHEVIKGISMNVKKGEKIAIVGKSGCGKTTLFNLITRLYDSYSGTITIDNFDTKNLSEKSLRSCISIVEQNSYVFNMSIIDNFHFVNSSLSENEIIDICKKVNLHYDILSLENGYNTVIGEDGQMLSGGQKQKLAIARCLARKSPIILLDEATSALDNISQQKVLETIFTLSASQTVVIIAHRLSTVVNCDRIYFMENGKIVANGTHAQLIKNCDEYKTLYNEEIKDKA